MTVTPEPGIPTQVAHPSRTILRTVTRVVVGWVIPIILVAPEVIEAVLVEPGIAEPIREALTWFSALCLALTALATRVMAIQRLQPLLEKIRLGTGVEAEGSPTD